MMLSYGGFTIGLRTSAFPSITISYSRRISATSSREPPSLPPKHAQKPKTSDITVEGSEARFSVDPDNRGGCCCELMGEKRRETEGGNDEKRMKMKMKMKRKEKSRKGKGQE